MEINPGYRISAKTDLFALAAEIRQRAHKKLARVGRQFYETMMKNPPKDMPGRTPMHCMLYTMKKLDQKPTEELISAINIGVIIRRLDDWYYLAPYCEFMGIRDILDFMKTIPGVEDFSYNGALKMPPQGVTEEQWSYREDTWEKLAENWMTNDLEIRICDYLTWFKVLDPWMDMMRDSITNMSMEEQRQFLAGMQ